MALVFYLQGASLNFVPPFRDSQPRKINGAYRIGSFTFAEKQQPHQVIALTAIYGQSVG
jgi:hypothetical protein